MGDDGHVDTPAESPSAEPDPRQDPDPDEWQPPEGSPPLSTPDSPLNVLSGELPDGSATDLPGRIRELDPVVRVRLHIAGFSTLLEAASDPTLSRALLNHSDQDSHSQPSSFDPSEEDAWFQRLDRARALLLAGLLARARTLNAAHRALSRGLARALDQALDRSVGLARGHHRPVDPELTRVLRAALTRAAQLDEANALESALGVGGDRESSAVSTLMLDLAADLDVALDQAVEVIRSGFPDGYGAPGTVAVRSGQPALVAWHIAVICARMLAAGSGGSRSAGGEILQSVTAAAAADWWRFARRAVAIDPMQAGLLRDALTAMAELADDPARADYLLEAARAVSDVRGLDLGDLPAYGVDQLTGLVWSESTQWPPLLEHQVRHWSVPVDGDTGSYVVVAPPQHAPVPQHV